MNDMSEELRQYKDAEGNPVGLLKLVRDEPDWAANQIRHRDKLERELAERKRVGDELARCAGQLGWTSADQPEWCRRAEVAVNAWRSLP